MENSSKLVPVELIEGKIYLIRGQKIMLDRDLSALYRVETKVLKQAVRRNLKRFPEDFMFVLSTCELADWRSQFVTSKNDTMGLRHAPMAFTEQGVAMLSGILNSDRAIEVNIQIMRTFVRLRRLLATHADLAKKMEAIESKYDSQFRVVFDAIRALMAEPEKPRRPIGFTAKEKRAGYAVKPQSVTRQKKQIFSYPSLAAKKGYPQESRPGVSRPACSGFPRRAHSQGVVMNSHIRALRQHNDRILDNAPGSAALRWG